MSAIQGLLSIEVNGRAVGTFRIVCYIMGVCFSGVSIKRGSTIVASSPGPTQKSGKGPSVTCKNSRMCCVSSLRFD